MEESKRGRKSKLSLYFLFSSPSPELVGGWNLEMSSGTGAVSHFLLFILVFLVASASPGASSRVQQQPVQHGMANETWVMKPLEGPGLGRLVLNETRRRLGSFQICALCTCCGGPRRLCLLTPCCYAINCNIPNRPFGFCSFTPKSCSCFGCYL